MNNGAQPAWTIVILAATVAGILLSAWIACKVAELVAYLRDALRDRYVHEHWSPGSVDIVLLPGWLMLEVFCFACGLLFVVIIGLTAMSAANSARDCWWHASDRS